jgi:hypothetical protein
LDHDDQDPEPLVQPQQLRNVKLQHDVAVWSKKISKINRNLIILVWYCQFIFSWFCI